MTRERSCSERPARARREVLCADLDRLDADSGLWQQANGDGSPLREMRCEAVRAAIATALTETQRRVVEAHFFEGLSPGQIARRFGVSQQVVQKCLYGAPRGGRVVGGAMRRLREALAPLMASAPAVSAGSRAR